MNFANYIVFDFETDGVNTEVCQPLQLAAVVLDPRTLKPYEKGEFKSYIRPDFDKLDWTSPAFEKNKITRETLEGAPPLKIMWKQFARFCSQYDVILDKTKKKPIPVGYNIQGFDLPIVDRLNKETKQGEFFSIFSVDVFDLAYMWFESNSQLENLKLDTLRNFFGIKHSQDAHNAIQDVKDTGEIFRHFLLMHRKVGQYIKWGN